MVKRFRKYYC